MPPFLWCKYHLLPETSSARLFLSPSWKKSIPPLKGYSTSPAFSEGYVSFSAKNYLLLRERFVSVSPLHLKEHSIPCCADINYSIIVAWTNFPEMHQVNEALLGQTVELENKPFLFFAPNCPKDSGLFTTHALFVPAQCPTPRGLEKSKQSSGWGPWKPPDFAFLGLCFLRLMWWLSSLVT